MSAYILSSQTTHAWKHNKPRKYSRELTQISAKQTPSETMIISCDTYQVKPYYKNLQDKQYMHIFKINTVKMNTLENKESQGTLLNVEWVLRWFKNSSKRFIRFRDSNVKFDQVYWLKLCVCTLQVFISTYCRLTAYVSGDVCDLMMTADNLGVTALVSTPKEPVGPNSCVSDFFYNSQN